MNRRWAAALTLPALALTASMMPATALVPTTAAEAVLAQDVGHQIATNDRAAVNQSFLTGFAPALETRVEISGRSSTCAPGTVSARTQSATIAAVNYMRASAGLDPIVFDAALSAKAQRAAVMMQVNDALNHHPPTTWACYSADGAWAAGHANLAWSSSQWGTSGKWIELYMDDPGDTNKEAGHRRWILTPETLTMGAGYTARTQALVVFGATTNPAATTPDWVAWPTAGFFPAPLEPLGRWSVASYLPGIDLSKTSVSVTGPDGAPVQVISEFRSPYQRGWRVTGLTLPTGVAASGDKTYRVRISGILRNGAPAADHVYSTTLFEPQGRFTWSQAPTIVGEAVAGKRLVATAGVHRPVLPYADRDDYSEYQWFRDGKPLRWEVAREYVPTREDAGHRITVRVTPFFGEFYTGGAMSATTAPIRLQPAPTMVSRPAVRATVRVGQTVRATLGNWSSPARPQFSFQWLRDGRPIRRAVSRDYAPVSADTGHRLSVRVTAFSDHSERTTVTTAPTARVKLGRAPRLTYRPLVYGTFNVGHTLVTYPVDWSPAPRRLDYQWLRDGKVIRGATRPRYRLVRRDVGHRLWVRVTALRPGHHKGVVRTAKTPYIYP